MPPPSGRSGGRPTDATKSNERNEYIPSFIAKKPFYIDDATASDSDYLEHQRLQSQKNHDPLATSTWYDRGAKKGPAATKYRKGACENCGSLSHKAKDCLQRKRKLGARWTGRDIAADDDVKDVNLGWDAKRDRWNGYDASEYQEVVEEFNALEEMKKAVAGGDRPVQTGDDDGEANADVDGAKYEEETDMGRQQATSTRNLRLREDTAKYLVNLDLDSAKYDPKTRSMVDPGGADALDDAGEGFARASGDAGEFERAQRYAWETQERGGQDKIHLQANPTEAVLIRKRKAEEEEVRKESQKKALLEKYGPQDAVVKPVGASAAEVASNERYVEYDQRGMIKGEPEKKVKSMYAEDVLINNHTSVWGSWWKDFKWGYACCHSIVKNSFCVGEEGRKALEESEMLRTGQALITESGEADSQEVEKEESWREEERLASHVPNEPDRQEKTRKDESRRRLEELKAGITEAEMEKYQRERMSKNDPMAKMLGRDELLNV